MKIESKHNQHIKRIRRLHNRKARQETGLFFVEGIRWVVEALAHPERVESVIFCPALLQSAAGYEALVCARQHPHIQVLETSAEVFESIVTRQNPAGIAAVVHQQWDDLDTIQADSPQLWIALHAVQYPGNLGTILRTSDAVGAAGVILLDHATDPYDPRAVRASVSAVFTQRLIQADFARFTQWQRQTGIPVIGTADSAPCLYRELRYRLPLVLLMGCEGDGLSECYQTLCEHMVRIPMQGRNDSLNVSVAAAVILYEILAQQAS